ncbi:DUF6928 family protein [Streptomyces sp. NPDC050564]|uniref:DUF6928 family protein n=1 Tax=Streptomyces sp. NPDC050564 TaxID=3365631 RepID=UPI0037AA1AE0
MASTSSIAASAPASRGTGASTATEIEECDGSNLRGRRVPPKETAYTASWPGLEAISDQRVMIDFPSQLPEHLSRPG